MKDIDHYQIAIIGFIVDVSPAILERTKIALTKGIKCIESDDRCFIYDPNYPSVPKRKGESAGRICNYKPPRKIEWQDALKSTIELMCMEDYDSHKLIMMVTDRMVDSDFHQISSGFNWDVKHDAECRFVICQLGDNIEDTLIEDVCKCHNHCERISHKSPEELEQTVIQMYRMHLHNEGIIDEPPSSFVSLDSLKEEYDRIRSKNIRD